MNIKGIWKTGLIAAAITLVAGMFVMRVDDWSKGFGSGFIAYGQSGGTTGGTTGGTGTGGTTTTSTKVIPQIVVGSYDGGVTKYITLIQIVNTGTASVNVTGDFYKTDGTASATTFTTALAGAPGSFTGTMSSQALAPNRMLTLSGESNAAGVTNWARITSSGGSVTINTVFENRLADGTLVSRTGVASSSDSMKKFIIPRMRRFTTGFDVGFALVNTGSTPSTLNATLYDPTGTVLKTASVTLAARSQTAKFAADFFSLTGESATTGLHSYMVFETTSTTGQWAAVGLAFEGNTQASFPVDMLQ